MRTKQVPAIVLLAGVMTSVLGGCGGATVSPKPDAHTYLGKRIAVVDISKPRGRLKWTIGIAGEVNFHQNVEMVESLEKAFIEHDLYEILDRSQLVEVAKQNKLNVPPKLDRAWAIKLARLANLDGVITLDFYGEFGWSLIFVDEDYRVYAKFIDPKTGRVVWSADASFYYGSMIPFTMSRMYTKGASPRMAEGIAGEVSKALTAQTVSAGVSPPIRSATPAERQ